MVRKQRAIILIPSSTPTFFSSASLKCVYVSNTHALRSKWTERPTTWPFLIRLARRTSSWANKTNGRSGTCDFATRLRLRLCCWFCKDDFYWWASFSAAGVKQKQNGTNWARKSKFRGNSFSSDCCSFSYSNPPYVASRLPAIHPVRRYHPAL